MTEPNPRPGVFLPTAAVSPTQRSGDTARQRCAATDATTTTIAPLLVDAAGFGRLAGVSRATIFAWQASGFCPAAVLRRGRVVRWMRSEIEKWCAAGCPARDCWQIVKGARP